MVVLAFSVIVDYSLIPSDSDALKNSTTFAANAFDFKPIPEPTFDGLFSSLPVFCFAYQCNEDLYYNFDKNSPKQDNLTATGISGRIMVRGSRFIFSFDMPQEKLLL